MVVMGLQTAKAAASLRIEQGAVYVLGEDGLAKHN
jgi:probable phosphoglycerate mutase